MEALLLALCSAMLVLATATPQVGRPVPAPRVDGLGAWFKLTVTARQWTFLIGFACFATVLQFNRLRRATTGQ